MLLWKKIWYYEKNYATMKKLWNILIENCGTSYQEGKKQHSGLQKTMTL